MRGRVPGVSGHAAVVCFDSCLLIPVHWQGLMVQQEDSGPANRQSGCNSQWVHSNAEFGIVNAEWSGGIRSRGPAATTPGLHPGNDGSSPSGITAMQNSESRMRHEEAVGLSQHSEFPIPHLKRLGRQPRSTTLTQNQGCCGFESHLSHLECGNSECEMKTFAIPNSAFDRSSWSSGVLAALSRRRSRVRILLGTPWSGGRGQGC